MSVTTTKFDLSVGNWTEVASGKRSVSIVLHEASPGSCAYVHAGSVAPAIGAQNYLRLHGGMEGSINLSGLGATDKVFARAGDTTTSPLSVIILAGDE